MSATTSVSQATRAEELPPEVRAAVRGLILSLADSKRLLGMRYAEWILGAPELEAGIACASMAQDEWGHARLLYALLREFGDDVQKLEHGRDPAQYRNLVALDEPPADWPEFAALNALADTALSIQLEALLESSYLPLRQRVRKLLDEEQFHRAHGSAWLKRLGSASPASRAAAAAAVRALLLPLLQWFGPDGAIAHTLRQAGIVNAEGSGLRARFVERVAPLLGMVGLTDAATLRPAFDDFDEDTRRPRGRMPDAATIARIRGDRNRAFLMD